MEFFVNRYCHDLPTRPATENKILVTGSTGYIGGELIPELVARGYQVRVMVRSFLPEYKERWPSVEIVIADALDYYRLKKALEGIHCAYYLIHSLHFGNKFKEIDTKAARNFWKAAEENNLKRIIYLGSLGNPEAILSDHLNARIKVAEDLQQGKTPVTFLRAAVIIGSGSASYKIINHLILNCPLFLFPAWANSNCQPIAIRDVIKYLVGCLEKEETTGKTFDIGGQDILTYQKMLKIQAKVLNKKRVFINTVFSKMNIYTKITSALTSVSPDLVKALMESCINDVVCLNSDIKKLIPFQTLNYTEALVRVLSLESQKKNFNKKKALATRLTSDQIQSMALKPPKRSTGMLSDIKCFLLHKSDIPTLINFNTISEREKYSYRILQRLNIEVSTYKILNIHKIGVNAPAKYIFEELLKWNGDSTCWPNYIAKVVNRNNRLENLSIYLFGWIKFPSWIKNSLLGRSFIPLFMLNAIMIKKIPDPVGPDNARYLLYKSSGGYPIGVFTMYVRSSIANEQEMEQSQLFLMVGFNFYGKENWSKRKIINRIWESIHDRVTSNVLNRLKQLSEWRFEKIKMGN
jgi:uncharacterized protein YbjT (DUF2867 family)